MRKLALTRFGLLLCALASGCTVITEAGDYEVDPFVPHLELVLAGMSPHAGSPVNVAVVSENEQLLSRAIVWMPDAPAGAYPDETITLDDALTPGQNRIYFFGDDNADGRFDPPVTNSDGERVFQEHVWVEDIPEDGYLEFTHTTDFMPFAVDSFTQQNDLVFPLPNVTFRPDTSPDAPLTAVLEEVAAAFGDVAELRVHLSDEDRQVGLFRRYRGTGGLRGESRGLLDEIRLRGIIDAGSTYDIELVVDGEVVRDFQERAPQSGDLTILPDRWLPPDLLTSADAP